MNPTLKRVLPLVLMIALLMTGFCLRVGSTFVSSDNLMDLAQQIVVNAVLGLGLTLTILIGGIDLSVGSVVALSGTVTVFLFTKIPAEWPASIRCTAAVLCGLGVSCCIGLANGLCASRTKMPAFIITLATMLIARGAALTFNDARPIIVPAAEEAFIALGNHRLGGIVPMPVVVLFAIFVGTTLLLHFTRFGQHLYAIGGNREAARFTGIAIGRLECRVYVLSALLAGIAGTINASQLNMAEPNSGSGYELNAIAAAVVGGTSFQGGIATTYGTLLGAVIIGILDKGLNQAEVHFSIKHIVKGFVILSAVYFDVRRRR